MFLLSDRRNHNLKTVLLSDSNYLFLYKKQVIFSLYQNLGGGALTLLSQAQSFRSLITCSLLKYLENMPTT